MAIMMTRTQQGTIHFNAPALLDGLDYPLGPGDYELNEDEELIEGISWLAYRRVATFITIPPTSANGNVRRMLPVDAEAIEELLRRDGLGEQPGAGGRSA
jgi:hypothetical protein